MNKIQQIQSILAVAADGIWGPKSQAAFDAMLKSGSNLHRVMASSFADPKDVDAFKRCKATGKTDKECFAFGDNGIGCWGDNTAQEQVPMCALPPDDMIEEFGSINAAKHKRVNVVVNGKSVECLLSDRMPWKANIKNDAGIDLNPAAAKSLGLKPPFMVPATWEWA